MTGHRPLTLPRDLEELRAVPRLLRHWLLGPVLRDQPDVACQLALPGLHLALEDLALASVHLHLLVAHPALEDRLLALVAVEDPPVVRLASLLLADLPDSVDPQVSVARLVSRAAVALLASVDGRDVPCHT